MPNLSRWLVLGAGSWLGHLLLAQEAAAAGAELLGTIHQQNPTGLPARVGLRAADSVEAYLAIVDDFKPDVVMNFLRGEDEPGFAIHAALAESCRRRGALYVYVSSVLALDACSERVLREDLPPMSNTPYGIFKGRCETHLKETDGDWLVLRFASVQGWAPHKATRNEKFLSRIARGEQVAVDVGVVQNRLAADWVVEAIRALAHDRVTGVIHLGATDASDEIYFLRRQAAAFGWDAGLVVAGPPRPVNLNCVPGRIFQLYGARFRRDEAATLDFLAQHSGLQRWRNPSRS